MAALLLTQSNSRQGPGANHVWLDSGQLYIHSLGFPVMCLLRLVQAMISYRSLRSSELRDPLFPMQVLPAYSWSQAENLGSRQNVFTWKARIGNHLVSRSRQRGCGEVFEATTHWVERETDDDLK